MESDTRDTIGLLYDEFSDEATRSVVERLESTINEHGMNCMYADQPGNEGRLELGIINNIIEYSKWILILHHGGLSESQWFQCVQVIAMNYAMANNKLFIVHLLAPGASFLNTKGFPRISMVGDCWVDEVVQLIGTEPRPVEQKEFCNAIHHMSLKKALEEIASMSKSDPSLGPPHTSGFIPRHLIPKACAEQVRSLIAYPSSTIDAGSKQDDVTLLIEKGNLEGTQGCEVVQVEDMASEKLSLLDEYSEQTIIHHQQLLDRNEDLHREVAGSNGTPTPGVALLIEEETMEENKTKGMETRQNYINVHELMIHFCVLVAIGCEHVFQLHSIAPPVIIYILEVCYALAYAWVIYRANISGKPVWGHVYLFMSIFQIAFRYHYVCINSETPNCKSDKIMNVICTQIVCETGYLMFAVLPWNMLPHPRTTGVPLLTFTPQRVLSVIKYPWCERMMLPVQMSVPLIIKGRRVYIDIVTLICFCVSSTLFVAFVISRVMMPILVFAYEAHVAIGFLILVPNYFRLCLYYTCFISPLNEISSIKKQRVYPELLFLSLLLFDACGLVMASLARAFDTATSH